jgi:hypothetical protein
MFQHYLEDVLVCLICLFMLVRECCHVHMLAISSAPISFDIKRALEHHSLIRQVFLVPYFSF